MTIHKMRSNSIDLTKAGYSVRLTSKSTANIVVGALVGIHGNFAVLNQVTNNSYRDAYVVSAYNMYIDDGKVISTVKLSLLEFDIEYLSEPVVTPHIFSIRSGSAYDFNKGVVTADRINSELECSHLIARNGHEVLVTAVGAENVYFMHDSFNYFSKSFSGNSCDISIGMSKIVVEGDRITLVPTEAPSYVYDSNYTVVPNPVLFAA